MSDLQQTYNYQCPANTTEANPVVDTAIPAGPYRLDRVTIIIPPGHCGLTGIQLQYGGNAMIPYDSGWISGDDEVYTMVYSDHYPPGASWGVAMINNDRNLHNWQVRWEMNFLSKRAASRFMRIGLGSIYLAADQQS